MENLLVILERAKKHHLYSFQTHATSQYKDFAPIMGKLAQTIIEYLDKDTNETVAILFPTNEIMCREDYPDFEKRLNHASRKDLQYQMKLREKYLKRIKVR